VVYHPALHPPKQYGLNEQDAGPELRQQLAQLMALLTQPQPSIVRNKAGWQGPLKAKTANKVRLTILQYLGYCCIQYGTPAQHLNLLSFANLQSLFEWFACLQSCREVSPLELSFNIQTSSRILAYMNEQDKAAWVASLLKEMAKLARLHKGAQVPAGDEPLLDLPDGEALLVWGKSWLQQVVTAAERELEEHGCLSPSTAVSLRDASMWACLYGEIGSHRGMHIITAKAPEHSEGPCISTDCTLGRSCKGNTFEYDPATQQHRFKVPHHKNQGRGQPGTNILVTDAVCNKVFQLYLQHARPMLLDKNSTSTSSSIPHMFVTNNGRPYKASTFCNWFQDFQDRYV
jgi:hypothetical protein